MRIPFLDQILPGRAGARKLKRKWWLAVILFFLLVKVSLACIFCIRPPWLPWMEYALDYTHFYFTYPHTQGSDIPCSTQNYSPAQCFQLVTAKEGGIFAVREPGNLFPKTIFREFGTQLKPDYSLIPPLDATTAGSPLPHQLFYSNSPEILYPESFPGGKVILARGLLEAGKARAFISHWNLGRVPLDLELVIRSRNLQPARLCITRLGTQAGQEGRDHAPPPLDSTVAGSLAQMKFEHDTREERYSINAGGARRVPLLANYYNCGTAILDLETDQPVELAVVGKAKGARLDPAKLDQLSSLPRQGTVVRGVFERPDYLVEARFDPSRGLLGRYTFGGGAWSKDAGTMVGSQWLKGVDQTLSFKQPEIVVNKGNYGSQYDCKLIIHNPGSSKYRRVVLLAVAAGGNASFTLRGSPIFIPGSKGLVLFNDLVQGERAFNFRFTYVANSSAPVHLIAIPLQD